MSNQIAENVFAFTGTDVNWVLVRDGTDLTLVDAGWHGDVQAVERSIRALGARPQDLRAVLLTHAHADHTGALNHLHDHYGVPVYCAAAEVPNARGEVTESGGPKDILGLLYRPSVVGWAVRITRAGALRHVTVPAAEPFPAPGGLDLPGRPVPVPTPGHTSGHTSYLLPDTGVVVSGDALVTAHPTLRGVGPSLLPGFFSHDEAESVDALKTLRELDADTLVPGHGPTWYGPIGAAADAALDHVPGR